MNEITLESLEREYQYLRAAFEALEGTRSIDRRVVAQMRYFTLKVAVQYHHMGGKRIRRPLLSLIEAITQMEDALADRDLLYSGGTTARQATRTRRERREAARSAHPAMARGLHTTDPVLAEAIRRIKRLDTAPSTAEYRAQLESLSRALAREAADMALPPHSPQVGLRTRDPALLDAFARLKEMKKQS
jgi:hypothetical protein